MLRQDDVFGRRTWDTRETKRRLRFNGRRQAWAFCRRALTRLSPIPVHALAPEGFARILSRSVVRFELSIEGLDLGALALRWRAHENVRQVLGERQDSTTGRRIPGEHPGGCLSAMCPEEEQDLLDRSLAGDPNAFARLFTAHRQHLLKVSTRVLNGDSHLAEDVVQDTFLRASRYLNTFDRSRPVRPWLVTIATRLSLNALRDGRRGSMGIGSPHDGNGHHRVDLVARDEDLTFEAVCAREDQARLLRALADLPSRQRRALLGQALDGRSYAQIATEEKVSVGAAKLLAFRARERVRNACRSGVLGTVLIPATALRQMLREYAGRIRARSEFAIEGVLGPCGSTLATSVAVLAVLVALVPQGQASARTAVLPRPTQLRAPGPTAAQPRLEAGGRSSQTPFGPTTLARAVLNPRRNATPEDTMFTSIAPSPNYASDHTLVAAGTSLTCYPYICDVLFISRDGGGSWARLAGKGFAGGKVLLPPGFPTDRRIFAIGGHDGLQVSDDLGASFRDVLPVGADAAAISPLFETTDPRVLVVTQGVLTDYWVNRGIATPATVVGPLDSVGTVAFSPAYSIDNTVFVGGVRADTLAGSPTLNVCVGSHCRSTLIPIRDVPWIRFSPTFARDRVLYAVAGDSVFRSDDAGATFTGVAVGPVQQGAPQVALSDLAVGNAGDHGLVLYAAVNGVGKPLGGVFRSTDGGATWTGGPIRLPGFEYGVYRIIRTPDGHLLAASLVGMACSVDDGRSWTRRCR